MIFRSYDIQRFHFDSKTLKIKQNPEINSKWIDLYQKKLSAKLTMSPTKNSIKFTSGI